MGYSKRQFVAAAFEEIGLASYVFDLQPEQLQSAMRRIDAMMADWNGKGIRLGYPLPNSPQDSDLDEPTLVPDWANEAIITNGAVRLAPGYGKVVMPETKAVAKDSYNTLLQRATMPPEQQLPATMPAGAGNKPWRVYDNPFHPSACRSCPSRSRWPNRIQLRNNMPTINQLSGVSQVSGGDLLPVYVPNNGDARKVSITQLLQYFQQTFAAPTVATNLYTPASGFNITVPTPTSEQQWMVLQPAGTLAAGTVTLPQTLACQLFPALRYWSPPPRKSPALHCL
jgi:hypothetical protein